LESFLIDNNILDVDIEKEFVNGVNDVMEHIFSAGDLCSECWGFWL